MCTSPSLKSKIQWTVTSMSWVSMWPRAPGWTPFSWRFLCSPLSRIWAHLCLCLQAKCRYSNSRCTSGRPWGEKSCNYLILPLRVWEQETLILKMQKKLLSFTKSTCRKKVPSKWRKNNRFRCTFIVMVLKLSTKEVSLFTNKKLSTSTKNSSKSCWVSSWWEESFKRKWMNKINSKSNMK